MALGSVVLGCKLLALIWDKISSGLCDIISENLEISVIFFQKKRNYD